MKKGLLISAFLCLASVGVVRAAGESALPDGNFGASEVGIVQLSTGVGGARQTRQIKTTNDGYLRTYTNGIQRSSYTNVASATSTNVMDGVSTDTTTANRNVFEVCSSSEPCFLKNVLIGDAMPGSTTLLRIRVWDTRGSTDTAFPPIYDQNSISTGTAITFDRWLSSGITVMQSNPAKASWGWSVTKTQ